MGHLFAFMKRINRFMDDGRLDRAQIDKVIGFMQSVNKVMGVMDFEQAPGDPQITDLVHKREAARKEGDFLQSDAIRDQLEQLGVVITDTPRGPVWRRKN
jgi:cysteinyl-tRNA synthetase